MLIFTGPLGGSLLTLIEKLKLRSRKVLSVLLAG